MDQKGLFLTSSSHLYVDVNATMTTSNTFKEGWAPLMFSVNMRATEIVKLLLQMLNINAERQSDQGTTALHFNTTSRLAEIVQFLLEKGASPNTDSPIYAPPLLFAASLSDLCQS